MKTLYIEVKKGAASNDTPTSESGYFTVNSKYNNNITICEGYISDNNDENFNQHTNKNISHNLSKRITEGTIKPDIIKKYSYKFYKSKKLTKLPNKKFKDLWENLFICDEKKYKGLDYFLFLEDIKNKKIIVNRLGVNRCILIHGPPGYGKSTLARAIAQKLSIRTRPFILFEINSTIIFSKYFGESSQKINEMFNRIKNKNCIVIIDEIESILISRQMTMNINDSIESVRVVNTFLNNLDELQKHDNIYFIYTTNFIDNLDSAFLDRIDIKIEINNMADNIKHKFISNILEGLMDNNLIKSEKIYDYEYEKLVNSKNSLINFISKYKMESPRQFNKKIIEKLLHKPLNWQELLNYLL